MPKLVITHDPDTNVVVITTSLKFFCKLYDALLTPWVFSDKRFDKLLRKLDRACEKAGIEL
jgi:hypothetical protein